MRVESIILFIINFTNLALSIFVFTRNMKSEVNKSFAFFASAMTFWGMGMLMLSFAPDKHFAISSLPILHLGLSFAPIAFFNFVLSMTRDENKFHRILCQVGYTLSLLFIFLHIIGLFGGDVTYIFGSYRAVGGPAAPLFSLNFLSFVTYGIYLLFKRYMTTSSSIEKNRIKYLLIGMYITALCCVTNILRISGIKIYPLAPVGILFLNIMIAYAIVKYRLMDITIIIQKGLVYSALTALVTSVWLSTIFTFEVFLHFQTIYARILAIIIIILIFQPVREKIQLIIDKLFYRERHDLQQLLKKASKELATIIDRKTLLLSVLDVIMETIHPKYAVLMLLDESSGEYKPESGLGNYNSSLVIKQDEPIVRWFNKEKRELLHEEVMENPEFNGMRDEVIKAVERMASMLFIPLISKDKLVGILNMGPKLSEKPYTQDEVTFLTTLGDETAVALENTKLYTDLKRRTIELEKRTRELQISNEVKSNFLKIVSHELRTPLTVIIGYLDLLSDDTSISEDQKESVKIMQEKSQHLNNLIGEILDLSKIERGEVYEFKKQPVDLKKIIEEVILAFTSTAQKKGITLQADVPPNLPLIMYDPELAMEIFSKLVDNAIKFIKVGQSSRLSTKVEQASSLKVGQASSLSKSTDDRLEACPTVTIRLEDKGNFIEVCVEDTGIGIKKENFEKIFERFYQVDMSDTRSYEGTGLGLSIVKEIIEQSGGSIRVESTIGKGSKFIFTLPKELA